MHLPVVKELNISLCEVKWV